MQEALGLSLTSAEHEHVYRSEASLSASGDKDQDRVLRGVAVDSIVEWLSHGQDARGGVADIVSLYMQLQGGGAHIGVEVEEGM